MSEEIKGKEGRMPQLWEALVTLGVLVAVLAVGIIVFGVDPHVPMFVGVIAAALMALRLGYKWETIEKSMMDGIYKALQSVIILIIVGILIGVWIDAGVVPSMVYYGLKILKPSIFFVAVVLICSITSLATGTSWGTMGTMGVAFMGIGFGLGMNPAMTAGAIISGAYFGDKMSPLSDTTNLAPAMAGTDVMTHVKAMMLPTATVYIITLIIFGALGAMQYHGGSADLSRVEEFSNALNAAQGGIFTINPLLLLPPLVVIVAVALKIPAIPGITLGIICGAILGLIFQPDCNLGSLFQFGIDGYSFSDELLEILAATTSEDTQYTMTRLLESGGIMGMMFSVSMTIIAMMFGGIMEETHQLEVIVNELKKFAKGPAGLVTLTEVTCVVSNATMPEQYIAIVVPGRMYAEEYRKMGLHPSVLSASLEGAGTVTSALIPWNTCGVFIKDTLDISTAAYAPFAFFNWMMPLATILFAFLGLTLKDMDNKPYKKKAA
ncbi:MAG: Na+/H+ antiporter NhaC [Lachnospiraceae bacterium]|nr:Na+/H+ antiporter NhaC [Lachnospiraceae bacterium]